LGSSHPEYDPPARKSAAVVRCFAVAASRAEFDRRRATSFRTPPYGNSAAARCANKAAPVDINGLVAVVVVLVACDAINSTRTKSTT
jgi:hypothetical protein